MDAVDCQEIIDSSALVSVKPNHHTSLGGRVGGRIEEDGVVKIVEPRVWGVVFEGLPLWLLALSRIKIVKLLFFIGIV